MAYPKETKQKRLSERGKVAINFELNPELYEKLRKVALEEDRTISAIVRRAIKAYVAKHYS